jgi:hypothetical protein
VGEPAFRSLGVQLHVFFFAGVTATAPSRDLTDNKKKEEGGLKQRRKQEEAAQGRRPRTRERKPGKRKGPKESTELRERRTEDAEENQEDGRRRQTHENGGETHRVSLQNLPHRGTVALGKGIEQTHCSAKPAELQGLQAALLHNTP